MITVSICGSAAGYVPTSRGQMHIFNAVWLPEVSHIMSADNGGSDLCLVYDPTHERVVAAAHVDPNGVWSIRPVVVVDGDAVVSEWGGADGQPHVPAALEALWAAEDSLRGVAA